MENHSLDSVYDEKVVIARLVRDGQHRNIIGGLWDEMGKLQCDFLKESGLSSGDRLLDIGCGSLRGGVHFAAYLKDGHYWGVDSNQSLLDAGYDVELAAVGLQGKVPREHLLWNNEFEFRNFGVSFNAAIAQSVFTHLSANRIRLCFHRLAEVMEPGGRLFATYFEVGEGHGFDEPFAHPNGVTTFGYKDPFHYRVSDLEDMIRGLPWRLTWAGDWRHPRNQKMAIFERMGTVSSVDTLPGVAARSLPIADAFKLAAGDDHYRAYVGPPNRFDFMSASQFALLFAMGLRDTHSVLDFGCGSLRLGRLLLPFLQKGRYHGIDPNRWLIEDALSNEIGWSIVPLKSPRFSYNEDFCCDVFDQSFDFVVAQSILTHCGSALSQHLIAQMASVLSDSGISLFSIIEAGPTDRECEGEGWIYPRCVAYREETIVRWCAAAGLSAQRIPWYHPGATWYAAARDPARLPTLTECELLRGAVLHDPQFKDSRSGG